MMLMEKIIRYFPLNRAVGASGGSKTLIKTIGKYLAVWIGSYIVMRFMGRIPLIGNLLYHLFRVWEYYVLAGMALSCYQYFSKKDYSNIAYINTTDFKRLWSYKQCKIALITVACILSLIPHGRNATVQRQTEETSDKTTEAVIEKETEEKTETEEAAAKQEETPTIPQEQIDLYEDVKGYWKGDGIQYAFSRRKDQYYFIYYSNGDHRDRIIYQVVSYEREDGKTKAVLSGQKDSTYDLEISTDQIGKRTLNIKEQGESEWISLTDNTLYSYQELLEAGEYETIWFDNLGYIYPGNEKFHISSLTIWKKSTYCVLDVTEQCEGDELIVGSGDTYYVMGIRDGFLQPLYSEVSFMDKERYDAENKILWFFYFGGTAGGSCYRRAVYDEDNDFWKVLTQNDIPSSYNKIFFSEMGKDYQVALREEEERLAREEQERADATITFDESMVITDPIENYVGEYSIKTFSIEINTIDEDSCSISTVSGIHAVGIGKRATGKGIPDGMAVYSVAGTVITDNHGNSLNAGYAVMLVLKPDGNIFIDNITELNPSFEFPAGTYRR